MAYVSSIRDQNTLSNPFSVSGFGVFSGVDVKVTCYPAKIGSGIVFRRNGVEIPADVDHIHSTPRSMVLGKGNATVQCVEHLLAAFRAFDLDNVLVEVDGGEIPMFDGSATPFVREIQKSGIERQKGKVEVRSLDAPVWWSEKNISIVALPSDELRYSFTLSYPSHPILHSQFYSFAMTEEGFVKEIAPARTFALYEEIEPLLKAGLIKGGGLENSVVIKGKEVLNPEGLRFSDEMVRHKVLDFIGDLSLIGMPLVAHYIAIRSGHASHANFARKVINGV